MAVVTEYSDLRTNERDGRLNSAAKDGLVKHPTHTQVAAGDADSIVELFTLKANEVLYPDQIFWSNSAWVATSTIDIGYAAHTLADGTAVAADPDGIATGIDGDAINAGLSLSATKVVESITFAVDVIITAQAKTAGIAIGDTCSLVTTVGQNHST